MKRVFLLINLFFLLLLVTACDKSDDLKGNWSAKKEDQINEDKSVIFQTSDKLIKEKCTLISNNELTCEYYSSKYVKNYK